MTALPDKRSADTGASVTVEVKEIGCEIPEMGCENLPSRGSP